MDRRSFLALSGLAAVAAGAHAQNAGGAHTAQASPIVRRIPSSGESLPAVGLGTSGPFEVGADESARAPLREVLKAFFAAGASLIDTSPMYSTAESVLGELLTPEQQAKAYDKGYFYPGPAIKGVELAQAPQESKDAITEFGRPEYDKLIADNPTEVPLDAKALVAAFDKWDREVGGSKVKSQ